MLKEIIESMGQCSAVDIYETETFDKIDICVIEKNNWDIEVFFESNYMITEKEYEELKNYIKEKLIEGIESYFGFYSKDYDVYEFVWEKISKENIKDYEDYEGSSVILTGVKLIDDNDNVIAKGKNDIIKWIKENKDKLILKKVSDKLKDYFIKW